MKKPFLVLLASAALVAPSTAGLAEPSPAPPLEQLVAQALERSPSVAALKAGLDAAHEMLAPAGSLPNPMIEVMVQNIGFPNWTVGDMEMSMVSAEFRQSLAYPGKRRARRESGAAAVGVAVAELEALRREVSFRVRSIVARIYAIDRELETLDAARELLDLLSETTTARYSVGQGEQEAVIKAQLEVSRLGERADDVAAERATMVAALNRLLDAPSDAGLGEVKSLPPVSIHLDSLADDILARSPEIAARRARVTLAEQRANVARLDVRPDLFVGGGYGYRGDLDSAIILRVGAELPLWRESRQEPMIRAAERELDAARAELRDAEAAARATATRLAAEWRRSERQVHRYREAVVPQSSAAIDAARSSYLVGRGDFSTVVEDFRMWLESRSGLARREADRFVTWAEVDALINEQSADAASESHAPLLAVPGAPDQTLEPPTNRHDRGSSSTR